MANRRQHGGVKQKGGDALSNVRTWASYARYEREIGSFLSEVLGGEVCTITKGPRRRRQRRTEQWTSHKFSTDPAYSPTVSEREAAVGLLWLTERPTAASHKHGRISYELTSSLRAGLRAKRPRVAYAEDLDAGLAPALKKPATTAGPVPPRHAAEERQKTTPRGLSTSRVEGIHGQAASVSGPGVGGAGVAGQPPSANVAALFNLFLGLQQYKNRMAPSAFPSPRVNLSHPLDHQRQQQQQQQQRQQQQQMPSTGRTQSNLPPQRPPQPSPPMAPFMLPASMPLNASTPGPDGMPLVFGYLFSGAGSKPPPGVAGVGGGGRLPPHSLQMPMPKQNQGPVMFLPNFGMLPAGSRPGMEDLKKMFINESGGRSLQGQVPLTSGPPPSAAGPQPSSGRSYTGRISQSRNTTTIPQHLSGYPFPLPTSRMMNSAPGAARITTNPPCIPNLRLATSNQRSGSNSGMVGRAPGGGGQPNFVGGMDPVVLDNGSALSSNQGTQRNSRSPTPQLNASDILSRLSSSRLI